MTKLEAALDYASRGWKILPCVPNGKIPLKEAVSHGVKDATDDPKVITQWWTAFPDANIGLACGAASGVWVIDVDVRPDKFINGSKTIEDSKKKLPTTLSQRTPSGGYHLLYTCTHDYPVNKNAFMEGVDIRSDNYYIVVAPSVINGTEYKWINESMPMAEFPDDFKPERKPVSTFAAPPQTYAPPSTPIIDRARAYLAEIPGAVEGQNGHGSLFWAAQVLVNGFRLSDAEVESLLWNEYNPRCVPPWVRNPTTEREFRHKIREAHSKPNAEALAIYDAPPPITLDDFDFDACIANVRGMLYPKKQTVPTTRQEALEEDLLSPDGLVGDIARWINETAICYQPLLALGASLTLCGTIMGRKVCDESDGRTNIYCMGIAPSSSGKDHPGDCINKILTAAGAQSLMMGRMTSDSSIERALSTPPHVRIAMIDEVGAFMSNINRAGDGASYLKTIKPTLMELFSSAHKTYIGKEKAVGNAPVIEQPCMCIWGVGVPDDLFAGMTVAELQNGWIARNLVFINDQRPHRVIKPAAQVPESIAMSVRSWFLRATTNDVITASPGGGCTPLIVPMDAPARARFEAFNEHTYNMQEVAHKSGDKTEYLWGKALQNARRIALIVACGKEYECPVIGHYEADYACRLVEMLIRYAVKAIAENVTENRYEDDKRRIRKIIASAGPSGITQTELSRRTQWVKDSKTRDAYTKDLADSNLIVCLSAKSLSGAGRTTTKWLSYEYAKEQRLVPTEDANEEVEHVDAE